VIWVPTASTKTGGLARSRAVSAEVPNWRARGRHAEDARDRTDLASQASFGAPADAGIGMRDVGVLATGCLTGGTSTFVQQLQKQIGQTGIPVFNVATGATALRVATMAVKAGEADFGMAVGVEKLSGLACSPRPAGRMTTRPGRRMIAYPNTRPMRSANCDGAAAAIVVGDSQLRTLSLEQRRRAVKISASVLTSDPWQEACQVLPDVNTLTRRAAEQAYEQAGVDPAELDLIELHDCFATAELVHDDNLGLCEPGGAVDLFNSGATWRDGTTPVNVSGGLESKGHPIAATGIANLWEVCQHLRDEAGPRQIEGARVGLAHVIGLGSACGVHVLKKAYLRCTAA
jgi:acetyl-CoA acetyltransferase